MKIIMRFSIVIPVYNNPIELKHCLESIRRLAYDPAQFEVIVVDNNSSDSTPTVAKGFGVTVIDQKQFQSSYAARNRGIRAARGEFIAFTDSDCAVAPDWLAEIDKETEDSGVGCFAGEILSAPPATLIERFSDEIGLLRQRGPLSGWHFKPYAQTANAVYRKTVFDAIGLFDPTMKSGGDAAIAWRMQDKSPFTLKYVPTAIVYHHHRTSVPELWKQFRRYGTGKMSWAVAQPDYTPPAIAKLEADAVAAFEKALSAMEAGGLDEKSYVFPVLRAATQMAHLSGYLQDLLVSVSNGTPLDAIPARARELVPTCNICCSTAFVPGPRNRLAAGRPPQCAECHALERHRVIATVFDQWDPAELAKCSVLALEEALPARLHKRFRQVKSARLGAKDVGKHDFVLTMGFTSLANGRSVPETLGMLVPGLNDDATLILIDPWDAKFDAGSSGTATFGASAEARISEVLPYVCVATRTVTDPVTNVNYLALVASADQQRQHRTRGHQEAKQKVP